MACRSELTLRTKDVKLHYARKESQSEVEDTKKPELKIRADGDVSFRIRFHDVRALDTVAEMAGSPGIRKFQKIDTLTRSG